MEEYKDVNIPKLIPTNTPLSVLPSNAVKQSFAYNEEYMQFWSNEKARSIDWCNLFDFIKSKYIIHPFLKYDLRYFFIQAFHSILLNDFEEDTINQFYETFYVPLPLLSLPYVFKEFSSEEKDDFLKLLCEYGVDLEQISRHFPQRTYLEVLYYYYIYFYHTKENFFFRILFVTSSHPQVFQTLLLDAPACFHLYFHRERDAFCSLCYQPSTQLVYCQGPCHRSFHKTCLPPDLGTNLTFLCADCRSSIHLCSLCGQRGIVNDTLFACAADCGQFYHYKCLYYLYRLKLVQTSHSFEEIEEPALSESALQQLVQKKNSYLDHKKGQYPASTVEKDPQALHHKPFLYYCPLHICHHCCQSFMDGKLAFLNHFMNLPDQCIQKQPEGPVQQYISSFPMEKCLRCVVCKRAYHKSCYQQRFRNVNVDSSLFYCETCSLRVGLFKSIPSLSSMSVTQLELYSDPCILIGYRLHNISFSALQHFLYMNQVFYIHLGDLPDDNYLVLNDSILIPANYDVVLFVSYPYKPYRFVVTRSAEKSSYVYELTNLSTKQIFHYSSIQSVYNELIEETNKITFGQFMELLGLTNTVHKDDKPSPFSYKPLQLSLLESFYDLCQHHEMTCSVDQDTECCVLNNIEEEVLRSFSYSIQDRVIHWMTKVLAERNEGEDEDCSPSTRRKRDQKAQMKYQTQVVNLLLHYSSFLTYESPNELAQFMEVMNQFFSPDYIYYTELVNMNQLLAYHSMECSERNTIEEKNSIEKRVFDSNQETKQGLERIKKKRISPGIYQVQLEEDESFTSLDLVASVSPEQTMPSKRISKSPKKMVTPDDLRFKEPDPVPTRRKDKAGRFLRSCLSPQESSGTDQNRNSRADSPSPSPPPLGSTTSKKTLPSPSPSPLFCRASQALLTPSLHSMSPLFTQESFLLSPAFSMHSPSVVSRYDSTLESEMESPSKTKDSIDFFRSNAFFKELFHAQHYEEQVMAETEHREIQSPCTKEIRDPYVLYCLESSPTPIQSKLRSYHEKWLNNFQSFHELKQKSPTSNVSEVEKREESPYHLSSLQYQLQAHDSPVSFPHFVITPNQ